MAAGALRTRSPCEGLATACPRARREKCVSAPGASRDASGRRFKSVPKRASKDCAGTLCFLQTQRDGFIQSHRGSSNSTCAPVDKSN